MGSCHFVYSRVGLFLVIHTMKALLVFLVLTSVIAAASGFDWSLLNPLNWFKKKDNTEITTQVITVSTVPESSSTLYSTSRQTRFENVTLATRHPVTEAATELSLNITSSSGQTKPHSTAAATGNVTSTSKQSLSITSSSGETKHHSNATATGNVTSASKQSLDISSSSGQTKPYNNATAAGNVTFTRNKKMIRTTTAKVSVEARKNEGHEDQKQEDEENQEDEYDEDYDDDEEYDETDDNEEYGYTDSDGEEYEDEEEYDEDETTTRKPQNATN